MQSNIECIQDEYQYQMSSSHKKIKLSATRSLIATSHPTAMDQD